MSIDNSIEEEGTSPQKKKRTYRGTVQAEVAALTQQRIIQAGLALFDEHWGDDITLDQIAERAGVTTQTLLRHFGSKDQLANAISQEAFRLAQQQLAEPPDGDIASIVHGLVVYYEAGGARMLRGLAQEERYVHLHTIIDIARTSHKAWLERVFASFLAQCDTAERMRLLAQLYTLTSVYTWQQLRQDCALSVEETEDALYDMLMALLARKS
ncbi:MAG TPA: TetR/AcrR family transcriptional regulator [Ktedonobacteraceae bacterium]|jgi:AcrR family transcriptional regulator